MNHDSARQQLDASLIAGSPGSRGLHGSLRFLFGRWRAVTIMTSDQDECSSGADWPRHCPPFTFNGCVRSLKDVEQLRRGHRVVPRRKIPGQRRAGAFTFNGCTSGGIETQLRMVELHPTDRSDRHEEADRAGIKSCLVQPQPFPAGLTESGFGVKPEKRRGQMDTAMSVRTRVQAVQSNRERDCRESAAPFIFNGCIRGESGRLSSMRPKVRNVMVWQPSRAQPQTKDCGGGKKCGSSQEVRTRGYLQAWIDPPSTAGGQDARDGTRRLESCPSQPIWENWRVSPRAYISLLPHASFPPFSQSFSGGVA